MSLSLVDFNKRHCSVYSIRVRLRGILYMVWLALRNMLNVVIAQYKNGNLNCAHYIGFRLDKEISSWFEKKMMKRKKHLYTQQSFVGDTTIYC